MSHNSKQTRRRVLKSIGGAGIGTLALSSTAVAEKENDGEDDVEPDAVQDVSLEFTDQFVNVGDSVVAEAQVSTTGAGDTNLWMEFDAAKFDKPETVASNVNTVPSIGGTDGWEYLSYSDNIGGEAWYYDSGHLAYLSEPELYHHAAVTPSVEGTHDAYAATTTTVPNVEAEAALIVE